MTINNMFKLGMDRDIPNLLDFENGIILNVGCGNKLIEGSIGIDYPKYDADIDDLPYNDNTISGIHAYHFLEHVKYPIKVLYDFQRVLKNNGIVNIVVPYYNSQMQAQDLDHKNVFCEETWKILFSNKYYDKNRINWKFRIGANFIIGICERNISLFTQLIKEDR